MTLIITILNAAVQTELNVRVNKAKKNRKWPSRLIKMAFTKNCKCGHTLNSHLRFGCEWAFCKCERTRGSFREKRELKKHRGGNIRQYFTIEECDQNGKPIIIQSKNANQINNNTEEFNK